MAKADAKLNASGFVSNTGWLGRFKDRHVFKTANGESSAVATGVVNAFTKYLPDMLSHFSPRDIYSTDEPAVLNCSALSTGTAV